MSDYFVNIYISNCVFKKSKLSFKHLIVVPKKHGTPHDNVETKLFLLVMMTLATLMPLAIY